MSNKRYDYHKHNEYYHDEYNDEYGGRKSGKKKLSHRERPSRNKKFLVNNNDDLDWNATHEWFNPDDILNKNKT